MPLMEMSGFASAKGVFVSCHITNWKVIPSSRETR